MKGMFAFVAAALLLSGVPAYAQDAAADAKAMTAIGTVKTVAADSIVVTDKDGKDWTFVVDKTTKAYAKGGSHMADEKKASGETMLITDSVKVGDKVNIKYHEMGEKKHAASVRVL
jgi:hypothetical protein